MGEAVACVVGAVVSSRRMGNAKGARGPREENSSLLDFSSRGLLAITHSYALTNVHRRLLRRVGRQGKAKTRKLKK